MSADIDEIHEFERGATIIEPERGTSIVGKVVEGLVMGETVPQRSRIKGGPAWFWGAGQWLGVECIRTGLGNRLRYVALQDTRVRLMPLEWLREEASREVLLEFLGQVSWEWTGFTGRAYLKADSLERRVLFHLIILRNHLAAPEIPVPQKELAAWMGIDRSYLNKVLKGLESKGLVTCGRGEIVVEDMHALNGAFWVSDDPVS